VAAPVAARERVATMDVLRGVALFGVFLVNFMTFAGVGTLATEGQLMSLPHAPLDFTLHRVLVWLTVDKANTMFAFLFGLGFYLQMQRLEARGVNFEQLYRRRLTVLLVIGIIHNFFIWTWDILHLYALAGFVLLALRRLSNRGLIVGGIVLALSGRLFETVLGALASSSSSTDFADPYTETAVLLRHKLAVDGDYFGIVANFFNWTMVDYVLSGAIIGWLLYALGRFLIGAWVGRHRWIEDAASYLPGWRRMLRWTLPAGLALDGVACLLGFSSLLPQFEQREFLEELTHLIAVPVLAAGYVSAVVVGFHSAAGHKWLAPFAWTGRMALTNYLTQSLVYGFVLFGVGPGLGLAGNIGTTAVFGTVVGFFALQMVFSRWWLGQFAYGPAEWVWRALTYGNWPKMRLTSVAGGNHG
jgi:uncharacterized protein